MLKLVNGDYAAEENGLQTVEGNEAVLQRVLLKLTARRGAFPFLEDFGSRLWTLGRLNGAARQAAAEQYVAEALAEEEGLTVETVTLTPETEGRMRLTAALQINGTGMMVEVALQ